MSLRWVCILLALITVGCSRPSVRSINEDTVIVAFGDSLTRGTGAESTESFPAVLQDLLVCKVVNEGVPGEVTSDGLLRLPGVLALHKPDIVIICHGGNDFLNKVKDEDVGRNIEQMIMLCEEAGASVVVIAVPKPGLILKVPSLYKDAASRRSVTCEDELIADVLSKSNLKSDYVHPNAKGYRVIAEGLAEFIKVHQK